MMNILAIDTTGLVASVAIVNEEKTIAEFSTDFQKTHSETLMPMIEAVFSLTGLEMRDMDYLACASGPGSFTGLRIGVATAKGLAFGANKQILPVPTLDAMAYNVGKREGIIAPLMDARRNQAYTAFYRWSGSVMHKIKAEAVLDIQQILQELSLFYEEITFLGDGVPVFCQAIEASGLSYDFAPPHLNRQRAAAVGSLALRLAGEGRAVWGKDFIPDYLRKSQAERELEERQK